MLLDLSRFRGTEDRIERREDPAAVSRPGDEFRVVTPVDFAADVRKDQEKVRLVGRMHTSLELDCSRCLDPYQIPVDARIDLMFLPGSANTGLTEAKIEDEDIGVSFYRDDVIDLTEVIREQCHLALPMKPLCRDDCRGLCPVCGINRNRETCDCQPTWVDPRLEPLRALKKT
jgi:uncharacterized protein